jgi:hypothetical protein
MDFSWKKAGVHDKGSAKNERSTSNDRVSFRWLSYRHSADASQLILVQYFKKGFRVALYYKSG